MILLYLASLSVIGAIATVSGIFVRRHERRWEKTSIELEAIADRFKKNTDTDIVTRAMDQARMARQAERAESAQKGYDRWEPIYSRFLSVLNWLGQHPGKAGGYLSGKIDTALTLCLLQWFNVIDLNSLALRAAHYLLGL